MERYLDVSMLEPCEPLEQTLEAIRDLAQGDYLKVVHRREPQLLFPLLDKAGFDWRCLEQGDSCFYIYIWRRGDDLALAEMNTDAT